MGILNISMRVIQGYTIESGLFEIWVNTENRLKLIEMDNSFYMDAVEMKGRNWILQIFQEKYYFTVLIQIRNIEKGGE